MKPSQKSQVTYFFLKIVKKEKKNWLELPFIKLIFISKKDERKRKKHFSSSLRTKEVVAGTYFDTIIRLNIEIR